MSDIERLKKENKLLREELGLGKFRRPITNAEWLEAFEAHEERLSNQLKLLRQELGLGERLSNQLKKLEIDINVN